MNNLQIIMLVFAKIGCNFFPALILGVVFAIIVKSFKLI